MSKSFWTQIFELFLGEKCPQCGQRNTSRRWNYARGWNTLTCESYGDRGIFCHNCKKVTFDVPIEQHKKILPRWCQHYDEEK